ncbi:hypothetical protein ACCO45_009600 [Purpureocillium lilacinum]|uniref:Uncharacterized protein n=1 Tax=Purpureocillium lilacinum TaxID=33203 RepID=A0ACC4DLN1_PURLI
MGRLRYGVATTLDGFIASPDGSAAWIVEDASIDFDALFAEHAAFVMGRKTYEVMLSFGGPENKLAGRPKESVVVVSDEMKQADYPHITVVPGASCLDAVRALKASVEGGCLAHGRRDAGRAVSRGWADGHGRGGHHARRAGRRHQDAGDGEGQQRGLQATASAPGAPGAQRHHSHKVRRRHRSGEGNWR